MDTKLAEIIKERKLVAILRGIRPDAVVDVVNALEEVGYPWSKFLLTSGKESLQWKRQKRFRRSVSNVQMSLPELERL